MLMGQVWPSADFDGTDVLGYHGGRGSVLAVTAQNPNVPAPLNRLPIDVSMDTSPGSNCNSPDDRVRNFMSLHTGGAHFLLGDGSVRFVGKNINLTLYRALSTRDGGEVFGEF